MAVTIGGYYAVARWDHGPPVTSEYSGIRRLALNVILFPRQTPYYHLGFASMSSATQRETQWVTTVDMLPLPTVVQ